MLNTEVNEFAAQSNLTQVASYFDIVDNAVKTGDTNKRYSISTNACNAPAAPIKAGGWTSVVISPQGDNMCDLYNSFITVTMDVSYQFATPFPAHASVNGSVGPKCWIGFKDAMDCIEQYQLVANGQAFYTQSNAIEESYITSIASTDAVRKTDIFSKVRHKDAWNGLEGARIGEIVDASATGIQTITLEMKIDLRRILPLSGIRILPKFVGNMELRLKFGTSALVCTPCSIEYCLGSPQNFNKLTTNYDALKITNKFVPVGTEFTMLKTYASDAVTVDKNTLYVASSTVQACYSHLACFGLDDNLYQGLVQRYMNESLSFPVQTLSFQGMNGLPGATSCDLTLTATPRFVDTIFLLLQQTQYHHTCYENPLFEDFTLKMGGYGTMPDVQYSSYSAAFYEMAANAFNMNNDLTGFNKDVMKSLTNDANSQTGHDSNDISNFVMAFPVSTDFTWQQGQTSNTPITYQLRANFSAGKGSPYAGAATCIPMMGFLKDSVLAIQLRPAGPPVVALDEFDITSPAE